MLTVICHFTLRALSSVEAHKTARFHASARFLLTAMLLASASALFGGCALTENGGRLALEELPGQGAKLAGVFVTSKPIEPGPSELKFNNRGDIWIEDTGPEKIYGSFTEYDVGGTAVAFPGLEGYGLYTLTAPEDETHAATYTLIDFPFANAHCSFSDQEERMEADLYVPAGRNVKYYFNPVYQQADGQIYLLAGSGISSDSFYDGQRFSHSISESFSRTKNGEQSGRSVEFAVNIVASEAPQETELMLMDEEDRLLERYSEAQLEELDAAGDSLTLPREASYLILWQAKAGEDHGTRYLFDRDAEYVEYMVAVEDEFLYFRQLPLTWP